MRRHVLPSIVLATCLAACSASDTRPPHGLSAKTFPMPAMPAGPPGASFSSVDAEIAILQQSIGGYPPRFTSEGQRDAIYTRWANALLQARGLNGEGEHQEAKLYLLAELYRQGHNLDVQGAAPQAMAAVERCIELYPRSRPCHFSASLFYLSVTGPSQRLDKAERSLIVLREEAAPALDENAEAGFIRLAIARDDRAEANRLIERYLIAFPRSPRAETFRRFRAAERIWVEEVPSP
jgi:hypothetical protein